MLQGVISRASFRRQPRNGQKFFTVMSPHINNNYAIKRGIGKKLLLTIRAVMLEEHVELVAGDFNGVRQATSIIEETFADTDLPMPPGPTPLWSQVQYQVNGLTYVVLSSPGTLVKNGRSVCMELSQLSTRPSTSVQKIKVTIMRYGCTWTFVGNQYAHESRGNTSSGSSLKEDPLHTRLTRRKANMTMKATAHFHLCRLYENLCWKRPKQICVFPFIENLCSHEQRV